MQEKGNINPFELAQQDAPDKFQFPQKLYGREKAIKTLLETFDRVNEDAEEVLLVKGYSGIGKTALVQEVYKPLTARQGYFISGKFNRLQKDVPYLAFLQAFEGLIKQLLTESDEVLAKWQEKLLEALKSNGRVMTEVIPNLVQIIGNQPEIPEVPPEQAKNRFNYVFQNFIAALAQPEHPLTIFLDDLQWADAASLNLIEQMFAREDKKNLLLIGAYRDNEVDSTHSLTHSLKVLIEAGTTITTIPLIPLEQKHLWEVLTDALHSTKEEVKPLLELVEQKTGGNPFFIKEFLKSLYVEELISFNYEKKQWEWELAKIEARGFTENVIELMIGKLEALPEDTHKLLALAACVGNNFDLTALAVIVSKLEEEPSFQKLPYLEGLMELSEGNIYADLQPALVEGYILQQGEQFVFAHDRIHQAAYELIPKENREIVHFRIGKSLLASTPQKELTVKVFAIADHFNLAKNLPEISSVKEELINLNTQAGHKATKSGAYAAALNYFGQAMEHLPVNHWESLYDKSLDIYNGAMQAALLSGMLEPIEQWFNQVCRFAKTPLDKYFAYATKIRLLATRDKLDEVIECAQEISRALGFRLPRKPSKLELLWHLAKLKIMLTNTSFNKIKNLNTANNSEVIAYIKVMGQVSDSAYMKGEINLIIFINTVGVKQQLRYGLVSPFIFAGLGLVFSEALGDIKIALQLRDFAKELSSKYPEEITVTNFFINTFINHLELPLNQFSQQMSRNMATSLDLGDRHYAIFGPLIDYLHRFLAGDNLQELASELEILEKRATSYGQLNTLDLFDVSKYYTLSLNGSFSFPQSFSLQDLSKYRANKSEVFGNKTSQTMALSSLILLNSIFEDYQLVRKQAQKISKLKNGALGIAVIPVVNMHIAITYLQLANPKSLKEALRYIASKQRNLKHLAKHSPENYLHKWHLIEAERCRVLGRKSKAWHHYQEAVRLAKENGFVNEEALALELTAKFYLNSNINLAHHFLREAHDAYNRWGCFK